MDTKNDNNNGFGSVGCKDLTVLRTEPFWIFGYGSLCWNPGFEYQKAVTGYIKGFSRKFWQGNTTHRGTDAKPGRVATLVEEENGITWGKAFLVAAENKAALPYLSTRECHLGGYRVYTVNFHPKPSYNKTEDEEKKDALLYIASPDNKHWLGAAPLPEIARSILECKGPSGSNVEYLIKLAEFMREEVPEALDEHLFSLERLVRKFACDMRICIKSLMGDVSFNNNEEPSDEKPTTSFQYAARVPEKKLRCVNM